MRDPYLCTAICRICIALEPLARVIGPAGDRLYLPLRITGGSIVGMGGEKKISGGNDFAVMYSDEKLAHDGRFVVADPVGDILVWYTGTTAANEGAYDDMLDGQLPRIASCRLNVVFISTALHWRALSRAPLVGVGWFDGTTARLALTVLSVTETDVCD